MRRPALRQQHYLEESCACAAAAMLVRSRCEASLKQDPASAARSLTRTDVEAAPHIA